MTSYYFSFSVSFISLSVNPYSWPVINDLVWGEAVLINSTMSLYIVFHFTSPLFEDSLSSGTSLRKATLTL